MSFIYDLNATGNELLISKVRLELGDTDDSGGLGVKPDGSNLEDEEILVWLSNEGNHVYRATAAACEALARMWTRVANIAVGPRREDLAAVSRNYALEAKRLRDLHGGAASGYNAFSAGVVRVDGYANDIASDAVAQTGTDYEGEFQYIRPG